MSNTSQRKNSGGSFFGSLKTGLSSIFSGKKSNLSPHSGQNMEEPEAGKGNHQNADNGGSPPKTEKSTKVMVKDNYEDLIKSLTTETIPYVRKYAALKLGELGDKRAIEHLMISVSDENIEVRMASAQSLGKLGDESLVEKLIHTLEDSNEYLREQTVQTLVYMGEIAIPALTKALKSDNWMVSYSAVKALGRINDERAVRALADLLEDESNVYVQKAAIEALENKREAAEPEIIRLLNHEFFYVKEKAAKILVKVGSRESIEKLKEAVHSEKDGKYMERLKEYLKQMETKYKIKKNDEEE